jgi:hypothetical protein
MRAPEDLKLSPEGMGKTEMIFSVYDYGHCKPKDGRINLIMSRGVRSTPMRDKIDESGRDVYDFSVDIKMDTVLYGFEAKDLERLSRWAHRAALWIKYREKNER